MLPASRRVPRRLFDTVLKNSKNRHTGHFSMRIAPLPVTEEPSRFSVVVSAKVAKTAALRNLLKRRVRSAIERRISSLKNGSVAIFFAKKGAETLSFNEIAQEVDDLLIQDLKKP